MKNNTPKNNLTTQDAENISYVFPRSEEIVIHKSDLQIQLEKFKERILSSFSIFDLLAIISLWSPVLTADFKMVLSLTPSEIKAGYTVFAIVITIFILWSRFQYRILNFFQKDKVSPDSEIMTEKILEQCSSKPKSRK